MIKVIGQLTVTLYCNIDKSERKKKRKIERKEIHERNKKRREFLNWHDRSKFIDIVVFRSSVDECRWQTSTGILWMLKPIC